MPVPIKTLYFLDHKSILLVEIKRTDLPPETDKSEVYFWLLWDKSSQHIEKLKFVAMSSKDGEEERIFSQERLNFDSISGIFHTARKKYLLKSLPTEQLPENIKKKIQQWLT